MLDGLHDQRYRIERLESCMLGNGHVQFGGGPMEQGSSLYLASGLPNSVLSEFRSRLIEGQMEYLLFETMLTCLKQRGLLKAGGRQRTDATHVLAAVRAKSSVVCVGETMRAALTILAEVVPEWLRSFAPDEWYERYEHRVEEYRLPKEQAKRTALVETRGADGYALLEAIYTTPELNWFHHVPAGEILRQVWVQQFERIEGRPNFRANDTIPPPPKMICSPYDIEATYGRKVSTWWVGDIRASDGKL